MGDPKAKCQWQQRQCLLWHDTLHARGLSLNWWILQDDPGPVMLIPSTSVKNAIKMTSGTQTKCFWFLQNSLNQGQNLQRPSTRWCEEALMLVSKERAKWLGIQLLLLISSLPPSRNVCPNLCPNLTLDPFLTRMIMNRTQNEETRFHLRLSRYNTSLGKSSQSLSIQ